jgi:hypothetical protein
MPTHPGTFLRILVFLQPVLGTPLRILHYTKPASGYTQLAFKRASDYTQQALKRASDYTQQAFNIIKPAFNIIEPAFGRALNHLRLIVSTHKPK